MYNSRGQNVGIYDDDSEIYYTKRFSHKGQVFLKKNVFNGHLKERAIAIDKAILAQLLSTGCKKVVFLIIGIESAPYSVEINALEILERGVVINYDKRNAEGQNRTGFGNQFVISSVTDCRRIDTHQEKLNKEISH